jgi:hypothetical protein
MCFIINRSQNVNPTTITLLQSRYYHSALAPTLIILFSKVLKFSNFVIYKKKKNCYENYWIFKNILFIEWKFSNSFIYLTDMCQSSKAYNTQKYASITNTPWKKDGWPMIIISQVLGQHLTIWFYFNYDNLFQFYIINK